MLSWSLSCYRSTAVYRKFNAATKGRSISPSWTHPSTSFWLLVIPVWPGRWVRRRCDQQSNPAAPGCSPSQLPGRLCRATFRLHLGLPYASPTPAGAHVTAHRSLCCSFDLELYRIQLLFDFQFTFSVLFSS